MSEPGKTAMTPDPKAPDPKAPQGAPAGATPDQAPAGEPVGAMQERLAAAAEDLIRLRQEADAARGGTPAAPAAPKANGGNGAAKPNGANGAPPPATPGPATNPGPEAAPAAKTVPMPDGAPTQPAKAAPSAASSGTKKAGSARPSVKPIKPPKPTRAEKRAEKRAKKQAEKAARTKARADAKAAKQKARADAKAAKAKQPSQRKTAKAKKPSAARAQQDLLNVTQKPDPAPAPAATPTPPPPVAKAPVDARMPVPVTPSAPVAPPQQQTGQGAAQMRFLAQSALLEEAGTPRLLRTAMFGVTALVACMIAWASITKVDEVAVSQGQVLPSSRVQVIQHLEGGIVREISVQEGTLVKKGEVLMRLDTAASMAELDQARAKETILRLQAERLQAFAQGKGWKPLKLTGKLARYRHLIADQLALLEQQRREQVSQRIIIKTQIRQRQAEIVVLKKTESGLMRQLAVVKESYQMRKRLLAQGVTSRADYLDVKRDYARTNGELAAVRARTNKAREELAESKQKLGELSERLRKEALNERGKITAELAQVREKLKQLQDRVVRLEIRAPMTGYVKGLKVTTIGGVIQPGAPIMELVPADRKLIVEARISTRDIGHVHIGQRAKVKVDTYDFARYGAITGTLKSVSATTFQDDEGRPYYKGIIKLDKTYAGRNARANPVTPGMTVQADIVTGNKSILAYLLKPIYTTLNSSFIER